MAKEIKYGHIRGGEQGFPITVTATQAILARSSKFIKRAGTGTGTGTLIADANTDVLGHLETEELNSSDGTEVRKCINDPSAIYRVPVIAGTFVVAMRGKKCDIVISSAVQGAALNSATYGQLIVIDGDDVDSNWVDVKINQYVAGANLVGVV